MNDVQGNYTAPVEDGVESAFETFRRNLAQRLRERRTRREDATLEIPVADARRRLAEAQ